MFDESLDTHMKNLKSIIPKEISEDSSSSISIKQRRRVDVNANAPQDILDTNSYMSFPNKAVQKQSEVLSQPVTLYRVVSGKEVRTYLHIPKLNILKLCYLLSPPPTEEASNINPMVEIELNLVRSINMKNNSGTANVLENKDNEKNCFYHDNMTKDSKKNITTHLVHSRTEIESSDTSSVFTNNSNKNEGTVINNTNHSQLDYTVNATENKSNCDNNVYLLEISNGTKSDGTVTNVVGITQNNNTHSIANLINNLNCNESNSTANLIESKNHYQISDATTAVESTDINKMDVAVEDTNCSKRNDPICIVENTTSDNSCSNDEVGDKTIQAELLSQDDSDFLSTLFNIMNPLSEHEKINFKERMIQNALAFRSKDLENSASSQLYQNFDALQGLIYNNHLSSELDCIDLEEFNRNISQFDSNSLLDAQLETISNVEAPTIVSVQPKKPVTIIFFPPPNGWPEEDDEIKKKRGRKSKYEIALSENGSERGSKSESQLAPTVNNNKRGRKPKAQVEPTENGNKRGRKRKTCS